VSGVVGVVEEEFVDEDVRFRVRSGVVERGPREEEGWMVSSWKRVDSRVP